jgi:ABC-type Na+ transport system ATPase subunit NatA
MSNPAPVRSMIEVKGLVKTFGEVQAVAGISFEVRAGEIFAFLGPNGAGKTTTIQVLTTLLRPDSGSIAVDGLDPATRQREVRQRFGIVFQDPTLDGDMTAQENMELHGVLYHVPRRLRAERIEALLKLFELWERRHRRVKEFSGGMKRRLEIARGLLYTPRILFLDEPTLGLDPQSRHQLWTQIRRLRGPPRSWHARALPHCPLGSRSAIMISAILIGTVSHFLFRRNADNQHDPTTLFRGKGSGQDVMDQVLALHGLHVPKTSRRNDADNTVVATQVDLVWRRESLLQDSLQLSQRYCHCSTPVLMNRWAALRSRRALALSKSPFIPWYKRIFRR